MFSHAGGSQFFRYFDENFYSGLLTVAYELEDTVCNDGGFGPTPCPSCLRQVCLSLLSDGALPTPQAAFLARTKATSAYLQSGATWASRTARPISAAYLQSRGTPSCVRMPRGPASTKPPKHRASVCSHGSAHTRHPRLARPDAPKDFVLQVFADGCVLVLRVFLSDGLCRLPRRDGPYARHPGAAQRALPRQVRRTGVEGRGGREAVGSRNIGSRLAWPHLPIPAAPNRARAQILRIVPLYEHCEHLEVPVLRCGL